LTQIIESHILCCILEAWLIVAVITVIVAKVKKM